MRTNSMVFLAAVTAAAISTPASAATIAEAMTPLNIRSGPGPQYSIVGAIPTRGQTTIIGCVQGSLWCQVSFNGRQGWAYSQYLTARLSGRSLVAAEHLNEIAPAVTYQPPVQTVGTAVSAPAITETLVAPPAGEPLVVAPPPATVGDYVVNHPVAPVYLNGEVVQGVGLPQDVVLAPVPGYDYDYAYVNNVPVVVEPTTRRVQYMYR
ncbi:MAG TPA: DUF1236 domain-containing protein [Pseudolabrys sp.]|nr:DUF1236 domain-containing protein [Pseudolabrys sp.]